MSEARIEKHLNWADPRIYYEDGFFSIDISKNEVEIECDWDYGYGSRGTERIYIPIDDLLDLIKEIKTAT